jgi:excisionase family DNA binding protein
MASAKARAFVEYVQGLLTKTSKFFDYFVYCEFRLIRIACRHRLFRILENAMSTIAQPPISLPLEREVKAAIQGQRDLAAYLATQLETQRIQIFDEKNEAHNVELPTSALRLLIDILAELAVGNAVKVVPVHAELTTQEAADLLNVSRPHLIKLLESGELSYHKTGKHRRVRFADLMEYKNRRDAASEQAMTLLAEQAQVLRTGYE